MTDMGYIDDNLPLELTLVDGSIIKVIGVGGGGSNAVNHMYRKGITDVSFVVCNTDNQALVKSPVPHKIQLGKGLGAGGKPEVAEKAADESIEKIKNILNDNTKMVFITAGMGGGTGTGASPVIAKAAHDMGILTVGIVTIPFAFEGKLKIAQALTGVAALSEHVDAILVINNERLKTIYPDLELSNAFAKADDVLANAAKAIAEIITVHGYINTDFEDVYSIMKDGKVAIMNTGYASGEKRITKAIEDALNSPLLNTSDVSGASKILLSLYCSSTDQIKMDEVDEIHEFMSKMGENVQVIWGATFDDSLKESVKITLIATGFDVSDIPGMPKEAINKKAAHKTENIQDEDAPESLTKEEEMKLVMDQYYGSIKEKEEVNTDNDHVEFIINCPTDEHEELDEDLNTGTEMEMIIAKDPEIETLSIDDLEDDKKLEQVEKVPSWRRRFLR
jgi:cell division protein FtsZ